LSENKEIAVVGDPNTAMGFKLAGIRRVYAVEEPTTDDALDKLFAELCNDSRVGIIAVTDNLVVHMKKGVGSSKAFPIIVELPKLQAPKFLGAKEYYERQTTNILGFSIEL
jgi:V/A-type H+-transporting ATPase subunit F